MDRDKDILSVALEDIGVENILDYAGLKCDDSILYLGGRIDDRNLYPMSYIKYLNKKIKKLKPKHIICHSHWYAWKYYERGVLDKSMKIDTIMCNYSYLSDHIFDPINKEDYQDSHRWCIKYLIEKNPNIVFSLYESEKHLYHRPSVEVHLEWFEGCDSFDDNNLKYFAFDRRYDPPNMLALRRVGRPSRWHRKGMIHGDEMRNGTDGFAIIGNLLKMGFKNLNIIGFTAFGSEEDDSNFSTYKTSHNSSINNRTYFEIGTSEDQRAEADILKYWVESKKIYNLENYEILTKYLKETEL